VPGSVPRQPPRVQRCTDARASVLRIRVQELTPGLVDAVAVIRRGSRAVFIALRLEAVPGRWELIELLY
jgi:hypothetical protein